MSGYQPSPQVFPTYQGDASPGSSQIALMGDVPDAPGATGVVQAIVVPAFNSTIDPAIVLGVSCVVDAGVYARATASGVKIPIGFTPYTYDSLLVGDPVRNLMTRKGYAACIPVTRGRGFSGGAIDDSGRELYDFKDCAAAVAGTALLTDERKLDFFSWSGGGANALALVAKYPGFIRQALLMFPWGDYWSNPALDRSFGGTGIAGYQALMTARIGVRNAGNMPRYRARAVWHALRYACRQSTTQSWTFWDAGDPIGRAAQDMRTTLLYDPAIEMGRWQAEESATTSPIRWQHGLPGDVGRDDLFLPMNLPFRTALTALTPGVATAGEYFVPGHVVHYGNTGATPWELWTAPTGTVAPRTTALGGTENTVFVKFNAATGLFYVTPLGEAGCAVEILWNGVSKVADIAGPDTLFDMAN